MSKKALVVGAGKQGIAIVYALNKLGMNVSLFDINTNARYNAINKLTGHLGVEYHSVETETEAKVDHFDVVVSSAPYFANPAWAESAKQRKIPYCDLGGSVPSSAAINEMSQGLNPAFPVFTDLGLAPGLVNIMTEHFYHQFTHSFGVIPTDIAMSVGGLPNLELIETNSIVTKLLKYCTNFSVDGLLNEYFDKAEILHDGEIKLVDGMFGVGPRNNEMESFITSGGAANTLRTMKQRGVENCSYRTIRYNGHAATMMFLNQAMDREQLKSFLLKFCPPTEHDWVILDIELACWTGGARDINLMRTFTFDANEDWTAMQQMTAFPVAAIAYEMAHGFGAGRPSLAYEDVDYDKLTKHLKVLGINI